ncbi:MAG: CPBP family intramembrane metalloprotease [Acidimicrobiia bacterium]|nr:CPBP family intramembrane metalloprotease [Acidimicrobiia bacterium]
MSVDDDLSGGAVAVPRRVGETATDTGPGNDPDARYAAVQQYSLAQILGVWAAASVPMALLAWVVAPLLSDRLSGDESLARALLICLTLGLIWQFVLVLILMMHELGALRWTRLRDALWLRSPCDPGTGRVGGKTWWWAALFVFLAAVLQLVPPIPGPSSRDFADFLTSDRGEAFFQGAWGWFAVIALFVVFNTIIGEELLFRGVLLPRIKDAFGRADWVANGVLFAIYHLHQPWSMPSSLVEGVFLEAYPSRRFRSAWMGIIVHSLQSVFVLTIVFALVVG